jgi:hypothetical protein
MWSRRIVRDYDAFRANEKRHDLRMTKSPSDVRFTPKSGHQPAAANVSVGFHFGLS